MANAQNICNLKSCFIIALFSDEFLDTNTFESFADYIEMFYILPKLVLSELISFQKKAENMERGTRHSDVKY